MNLYLFYLAFTLKVKFFPKSKINCLKIKIDPFGPKSNVFEFNSIFPSITLHLHCNLEVELFEIACKIIQLLNKCELELWIQIWKKK